jgi:hypothetical protein
MQQQGSPTHQQHQRYNYYDRNGYYVHDAQSWHEPVGVSVGGAAAAGQAGPVRPDSPSAVAMPTQPVVPPVVAPQSQPHSYPSPSAQPQPPQPHHAAYSCKLSASGAPPSPTQKSEHAQYGQYAQCAQPQQPQQQVVYNNNLHGAYALTPEHQHGQPSPVGAQAQPQNNTAQAQLPSPLYPWMRSQFGKCANATSVCTCRMCALQCQAPGEQARKCAHKNKH